MKLKIYSILFVIGFLACSSDDNPEESGESYLDRIEILSSNGLEIPLTDGFTQLSVRGFDQNNNLFSITDAVVWDYTGDIVVVDFAGYVTANNVGEATISASVKDITAQVIIRVIPDPEPQQYSIFVSDAGNFNNPPWKIIKYDENGHDPVTFIGENVSWPQDILILEDENTMLISSLNSNKITRHDPETGEFKGNFALSINGPTRMKVGPDSLLYVLQWADTDNKVKRYGLDGTFIDDFTSVGVPQSIGIDWDAEGNLYISSYGNATVRKFDAEGKDLGLFISDNLLGPTNIWFDSNGDLNVIDYNQGTVKKFDPGGSFLNIVISDLNLPEGIAFFDDGAFLIGNGGTNSVRHYNASGEYIGDFIAPNSGGLLTPNAIFIRRLM